MRRKKRLDIYVAGSMEGRTETAVRRERRMIRGLLNDAFAGTKYDLFIRDPILKEKHQAGILTMHSCNLSPKQICEMDLTDVEQSHITYWSTADKCSEGSQTEFAGAGWFNRWLKKGWLNVKKLPTKKKTLIMVGRLRASKKIDHFQNMWDNVFVFATHKEAVQFLKKHYDLTGKGA